MSEEAIKQKINRHAPAISILAERLIDVINEQKKWDSSMGIWTELEYKKMLLKETILLLQKDEDLRNRIIELEAENYNLKKRLK